MTIQLLACDLDGTLIPDLRAIPARTHRAIQQAMARGVHVVLATGREYPVTRRFVDQLGLTTPVICYQGART
ncbi:MAG: HAD family phosphatase, partial [Chloroflexi bacterium]